MKGINRKQAFIIFEALISFLQDPFSKQSILYLAILLANTRATHFLWFGRDYRLNKCKEGEPCV